MNWIKKLFARFRRKGTSGAIRQELVSMKEKVKEFNARRLKRMSDETSLNYESIHNLARVYKITTVELVDYYCYFGKIPDKDQLIIIQHFGVAVVIAEAETTVEKLILTD